MRTYLQLVNDVLVRLRESQVTSVSQTPYSTLIGALVNDAKREVEDSWQWSQLLDYLTFSCITGISSYETNTMLTRYAAPPLSAPAGAGERTRLWLDPIEDEPILFNVTRNFERRLKYEPALYDQVTKLQILNSLTPSLASPARWQLVQSTFYAAAGLWNKAILLYDLPDSTYTMQLYVCNPQIELAADTDVMKVPTAAVVQKAYLYALYERGEELGEALTLTAQKVEDTLSAAVALDQQQQQLNMALVIPYGAQY